MACTGWGKLYVEDNSTPGVDEDYVSIKLYEGDYSHFAAPFYENSGNLAGGNTQYHLFDDRT